MLISKYDSSQPPLDQDLVAEGQIGTAEMIENQEIGMKKIKVAMLVIDALIETGNHKFKYQ